MKYGLLILLSFIVIHPIHTNAADLAATSEMPAALSSVGMSADNVVSVDEARQVRGAALLQTKHFSVDGLSAGDVSLTEGVMGNFKFTQAASGSLLKIEGVFGGLSAKMGVSGRGNNRGRFSFSIKGKALIEEFQFDGLFDQNFSQSYTPVNH